MYPLSQESCPLSQNTNYHSCEAEYSLFYRALSQKRLIILRIIIHLRYHWWYLKYPLSCQRVTQKGSWLFADRHLKTSESCLIHNETWLILDIMRHDSSWTSSENIWKQSWTGVIRQIITCSWFYTRFRDYIWNMPSIWDKTSCLGWVMSHYEWVMSHVGMSHGTRVNEPCHSTVKTWDFSCILLYSVLHRLGICSHRYIRRSNALVMTHHGSYSNASCHSSIKASLDQCVVNKGKPSRA